MIKKETEIKQEGHWEKKTKPRIVKKVCFITVLCTVIFIMGCSRNRITKTETETIELSTKPEESNVPFDMEELSLYTLPSELVSDSDVIEKQAVIDQLKKQAEDNAEKDRYNILEALGDAESDERCNVANQYIKENYPDYFSSEDRLQKSIEYGYYLASLYKDYLGIDNGGGRYYEIGELVSGAAQNVYLGINKSTDDFVLMKMQKLEKKLEFFYDKYYGKSSSDNQ